MIIPLKSDGNLQEWALIELQGDLKFDPAEFASDRYIGDLHYTKSGIPILIIGIHILHGKEMALPKPLAVLEKTSVTVQDEEQTEYIVKAIVKKKCVFRSRPKPIVITNVQKCL